MNLAELCKDWQPGDDRGFAKIVHAYLASTGGARVLADAFETTTPTILRWANAISRPRARMQRDVVEWIAAHANQRTTEA